MASSARSARRRPRASRSTPAARAAGRDAGWLVLDVAGAADRVEVAGADIVGETSVVDGGLRELVARVGGGITVHAPPYTPARLTLARVAAGDDVEIYGEVTARGFGDDGGPRDAPAVSLRGVSAYIVARGADAATAMDRAIAARYPPTARPAPERAARAEARRQAREVAQADPRRRDPGSPACRPRLVDWAPAGVALGLALVALGVYRGELARLGQLTALGLVATAVVARPLRRVRPLRAGAELLGRGLDLTILWRIFGPIMVLVVVTPPTATTMLGSLRAGELFVPVVIGAMAALHALDHLGTYAQYARIAATPSWTGELGGPTRIEGVVRDPTPATVGTQPVALGLTTRWDQGHGSDPDQVAWARFHADGTFLVEHPAGVVEVDPAEVAWASTVVVRVEQSASSYEVHEQVPVGGALVAVGWFAAAAAGGPPRLRSRGTVPALALATSALGEPLALLRLLRRERRHTQLALTALCLAQLARLAL